MDLSVRLLVGRHGGGEPADVRVELVSDQPCHVEIHAQTGRDDRVREEAAISAHTQPIARDVEHDRGSAEHADGAANVAHRDLIGIGHLGSRYGRGLSFLGHNYSSARADLSGAAAVVGTGKVAA